MAVHCERERRPRRRYAVIVQRAILRAACTTCSARGRSPERERLAGLIGFAEGVANGGKHFLNELSKILGSIPALALGRGEDDDGRMIPAEQQRCPRLENLGPFGAGRELIGSPEPMPHDEASARVANVRLADGEALPVPSNLPIPLAEHLPPRVTPRDNYILELDQLLAR